MGAEGARGTKVVERAQEAAEAERIQGEQRRKGHRLEREEHGGRYLYV